MALDTTVALPSFNKFSNNFKKPAYYISSGAISYNFGTHRAPVFLTYASSSLRASFNGSHRYAVISLILIHPIVRTASPLKKGLFLSLASLFNISILF